LLGASLAASGTVQAAPFIAAFEAHNDINAGALWRNNRPNNNNQRGAGAEHTSMAVIGDRVIVLATASYTDVTPLIPGAGLSSQQAGVLPPSDGANGVPGVQPTGRRIQGLCTSYRLDPMVGLVKTNQSYFTNNNSPDWQNAHKMRAQVIDGGKAVLALYGYDPQGVNTKVYGRVLGGDCQHLSQQTQLFAGNNDDYGGMHDGPTDAAQLVSDAGGVSRSCGTHQGNGNGTDDHRFYCLTAKSTGQTGTAAYTLTPDFNISIEANEERCRSTTLKTAIPDHMVACWAAGNAQPPNQGLRCGLVNTALGTPNNQRIVWRQYVQRREGAIYYTTPSMAQLAGPANAPTNQFILNYVKVDTNGKNGNKEKARTTILTNTVEVSLTGMKLLDTPKSNLFGITDGAHPGFVTGYYGADKRPVGFMFAGTITDGGTANVKIVGAAADGKLETLRAINWADSQAGGYIAQWYGHNPNTPQGRQYPPHGTVIANPGYGVAGGYQPTVKEFLLVTNVYSKSDGGYRVNGVCTPDPNKGTNNGLCGGKSAFGVVLIPVAADPEVAPSNPNDPNNPFPTDPNDETPGDGENGSLGSDTTLGGCSTTGNAGGAATLLLIGLGLLIARRRR
jgi:uncharacterized protein (TIGR03382 family)